MTYAATLCILFLALLVNVQHVRAICPKTPKSFLNFGPETEDTTYNASEILKALEKEEVGDPDPLLKHAISIPAPFTIFGIELSYFYIIPRLSFALVEEAHWHDTYGIQMLTMYFKRDPDADPGLAGDVHVRHSTRPADMQKLKKLTKCGKFTGAVIVTFECITEQLELPSISYQVVIAYREELTILLINTGTSDLNRLNTAFYFGHRYGQFDTELNRVDLADDGITYMDITDWPTGDFIPVLGPGPCHLSTKRCKLYEDGQVITLDGSIVNDTGNNVVATVHKWRYGRNNDPCKFYVKVHRDENYLYINRIRIGVGVSPDTSKEYLRTFVFDREHIEEKGPGVIVRNITAEDLPYSMNDTGSAVPLGITIHSAFYNNRFILTSATCGYSFFYNEPSSRPVFVMQLDGCRYDNAIRSICG